MKPLNNLIIDILKQYSSVTIPGVGTFVTNEQPSSVDSQKGVLTPRGRSIMFNSTIQRDDALLATFLSAKENIKLTEATEQVKEFSDVIIYTLNRGEKYSFTDVGSIHYNEEGKLMFEPSNSNKLHPYGFFDFKCDELDSNYSAKAITSKIENKQIKLSSKIIGYAMGIMLVGGSLFYIQDRVGLITNTTQNAQILASTTNSHKRVVTDEISADLPEVQEVELEVEEATSTAEDQIATTMVYGVVAGVFSSESNGLKLQNELIEKGYSSFYSKQDNGTYRVFYEGFPDIKSAKKLYIDLRNRGIDKDAWVIRLK